MPLGSSLRGRVRAYGRKATTHSGQSATNTVESRVRHIIFGPLSGLIAGLLLPSLVAVARGDSEASSLAADEGAYGTDHPREVENPFAVPPGRAELVDYVVGMNAAVRNDAFGDGGSAVVMDTAVRFGVASRIEGMLVERQFTVDSGAN